MAYSLPSPAFIAKHEIDPAAIEECLRRYRELPTRREAIQHIKEAHVRTDGAAVSTTCFVLMADDSVAYCRVGYRGGFKVLHNFGKAH